MTDNSPFADHGSAGEFLSAKDHMNDLAIIIEPKRILRDQPHTYEGITSKRDVAIADVSFFRNQDDINSETPSKIVEDCQITNQVLVADIERNGWLDTVALTTIQKAGRAYVWRKVTFPGAEQAAANYFNKRNADLAAALDDVPDFDEA